MKEPTFLQLFIRVGGLMAFLFGAASLMKNLFAVKEGYVILTLSGVGILLLAIHDLVKKKRRNKIRGSTFLLFFIFIGILMAILVVTILMKNLFPELKPYVVLLTILGVGILLLTIYDLVKKKRRHNKKDMEKHKFANPS